MHGHMNVKFILNIYLQIGQPVISFVDQIY